MPKRKDAVGGARHDPESVASKKKTKVETPQEQEIPPFTQEENLIEDVNALSIDDFRERFVDQDLLEYHSDRTESQSDFQISLVGSDWLAPGEYNAAYRLVETTSRADYESSTSGWHPRKKRKEMLGPDIKYLLVRRKGAEPTVERRKDVGDLDTSIEGFLSFMVDYDSTPPVPVFYIYEIHLAKSLRGLGLGNHLMHIADLLSQSIGLEKVMLTCFLCNKKAYQFYADHGFVKDACSPEDRKMRNKVVSVDYAILSKDVQNVNATPLRVTDSQAPAGWRMDFLDTSVGMHDSLPRVRAA